MQGLHFNTEAKSRFWREIDGFGATTKLPDAGESYDSRWPLRFIGTNFPIPFGYSNNTVLANVGRAVCETKMTINCPLKS